MELRKLTEGLWAVETVLRLPGGLRMPTRSVAVRLGSGALAVVSPLEGLGALKAELSALGPVQALLAPTGMHHLAFPEVLDDFPGAKAWARPSVRAKRPEVPWFGTLGAVPEPLWAGELEQLEVAGMPRLDEVALFHRPSKTLLLSDLCFNLTRLDHGVSRVLMRLNDAFGRFGPSRIARSMVKDPAALRGSIERLLAWGPERIVPCHGEVVERDAAAALEQAFAFLPRKAA